jgi:hypothetical protein
MGCQNATLLIAGTTGPTVHPAVWRKWRRHIFLQLTGTRRSTRPGVGMSDITLFRATLLCMINLVAEC